MTDEQILANALTSTIDRVVSNARRLRIDAFHASVALDLVAPVDGRTWTAICCGCLDSVEHDIADDHMRRISMAASQSAGGCMRCSYTGCDTLVAAIKADYRSDS